MLDPKPLFYDILQRDPREECNQKREEVERSSDPQSAFSFEKV
jgi:hypothetical protein